MLGGAKLADRHVFDHAPAQRAHRLAGHGDAPVLGEGCEFPISRQHALLRYPLGCIASRSGVPRERFSPLTRKGQLVGGQVDTPSPRPEREV